MAALAIGPFHTFHSNLRFVRCAGSRSGSAPPARCYRTGGGRGAGRGGRIGRSRGAQKKRCGKGYRTVSRRRGWGRRASKRSDIPSDRRDFTDSSSGLQPGNAQSTAGTVSTGPVVAVGGDVSAGRPFQVLNSCAQPIRQMPTVVRRSGTKRAWPLRMGLCPFLFPQRRESGGVTGRKQQEPVEMTRSVRRCWCRPAAGPIAGRDRVWPAGQTQPAGWGNEQNFGAAIPKREIAARCRLDRRP